MFDKVLEALKHLDAILAAIVVAFPLILQWVQRGKAMAEETKKKHDDGLAELVPWVVRKGHKAFAMYKSWHGYSNSQKKEELKDLIVAAHRRHNGKSAIDDADLEKVLHWAEAYWKDNKTALKSELNEEQPVVAAVLDALAASKKPRDQPGDIPAEMAAAALTEAVAPGNV
jgi:hypothetical protein